MRIRSSWNKLINHTHICAYDFRGTNSLTNFFLCVHMIWVCVWFVYGIHKLSMSSWYSWTNHTHIRISFMCAYDMSTRMVCLWVPRTVYEFVVLIDKPYAHTNFFYMRVWYEYAYGLSMSSTNCLWVRHRQTIPTFEFLLCVRMIWVCVWFVYEFHELSMSSWYS